MKNIKLNISVILVALMTLLSAVSCQKEGASAPAEGKKVEFVTTVSRVANNTWEANDAIGIYMKKAGNPLSTSSILGDNHKFLYGGAKFAPAQADQSLFFPASGAVDFVAYYPHATIEEGYVYKVSVSDQTKPAAIDLLYSNDATGKDASTGSVALTFEHKLSKILLNVTSDAFSDEVLAGKAITATVNGMPLTADFSLVDGSFGTLGAAGNLNMLRIAATTKLEAIVVPNSGAGRSVEVKLDGKTYKSNILDTDIFESGKTYVYTASIGAVGLTLTRNSILPWGGESIEVLDITGKFTDNAFRASVFTATGKVEANGDRILSTDLTAITTLDVSNQGISSLSGLKYFTGLTKLDCSQNSIATIDLSGCEALTTLNCENNMIDKIDISKNTALVNFVCHNNPFGDMIGGNFVFKINVWEGFDYQAVGTSFPDPTNDVDGPRCGKWIFITPGSGTPRTVLVHYIFPTA